MRLKSEVSPLHTELAASAPSEAAVEVPSVSAPAFPLADEGGGSGSWLLPGPNLVTVAT